MAVARFCGALLQERRGVVKLKNAILKLNTKGPFCMLGWHGRGDNQNGVLGFLERVFVVVVVVVVVNRLG